MKKVLKYKGVLTFYLIIACITYGLILRVDNLEQNASEDSNKAVVINLWK